MRVTGRGARPVGTGWSTVRVDQATLAAVKRIRGVLGESATVVVRKAIGELEKRLTWPREEKGA